MQMNVIRLALINLFFKINLILYHGNQVRGDSEPGHIEMVLLSLAMASLYSFTNLAIFLAPFLLASLLCR